MDVNVSWKSMAAYNKRVYVVELTEKYMKPFSVNFEKKLHSYSKLRWHYNFPSNFY